ncbi:Altered inheritance of mitochondria protein 32 [Phytophthora citrophthora]|uniref:Altered inheritance of mitochondria protein 32 n=1 Tax=Phytophthora citrophthora TaxID=4793 RepID=A0AAD9LNV7_9STRA|nr:Altered inheritance of mitochondria protein 32 [Phytophthora citrophthora]
MHRFTKSLVARAAVSQRLRPQSLSRCVVFFSTNSPQMGKRLTPEELAERRAKRAERRAAEGKGDAKEEKSDALFIEGSVRQYHRHYVIVEPENTDPNAWPAKLERTPEHILSSYVGALMKLYGGDMAKFKKSPLIVTAAIPYTGMCSGGLREDSDKPTEILEEGAHDILVFPDFVRVHNVVPSQISTLVSKSLEKDLDLPALLKQENLQYTSMEEAYHMMVCGHAARDERCGCKGPELLGWLKDSSPDANKPLNLWTSSHYGGHRYAAACIVYPSGDWFGLLNDEDKAKGMLDAVNNEDPLRVYELWRGRMGLTAQEMLQAVKDRLETPEAVAENA